jgi:hypothetical protein
LIIASELLFSVICSCAWIGCAWNVAMALRTRTVVVHVPRPSGRQLRAAEAEAPARFWACTGLLVAALIGLGFLAAASLALACIQ